MGILVLFLIFLLFRSKTTYLGDGQLRTNQIVFGAWFLPTEALDFLIHALLFKYIFQPLGYSPMNCYQFVSAIFGGLFILGIWKVSRQLSESFSLLPFLILSSSGIIVLFFGYTESYSIIAALLPFLFLTGYRAHESPKHLRIFIILFLIGCATHSITLFLFAPAAIILVIHYVTHKYISAASLFAVSAMIILLIIVSIYIAAKFALPEFAKYLIPILKKSNSDDYLFGTRHWLDILNILALASLPLFLLPLPILKKLSTDALSDRRNLFLFSLIVPSLCTLIFFNPQLGMARDWDLFAIPAFAVLLAALFLYRNIVGNDPPSGILAAILLSLAITASFIMINNSVEKSTARFDDLISLQKNRNLFNEYNLLNAYASDYPEINNRWLEFALKAWNQPPPTREDSTLILNKLGEYYLKKGDFEKSNAYLSASLRTDSSNLLTYHYLIGYYNLSGNSNGLIQLASMMERHFSSQSRGLMDAGQLYCQLGYLNKGGECFQRAYALDSNDVFIMVNYGVYLLRAGNMQESLFLLKKASYQYPNYFAANYNLSLAYIGVGDKKNALYYLERAMTLAANKSDSSQVANILSRLGR